jgi:hypothetical protein
LELCCLADFGPQLAQRDGLKASLEASRLENCSKTKKLVEVRGRLQCKSRTLISRDHGNGTIFFLTSALCLSASRDALAFYAEFSNFVYSLILMLAPSLRAISATTEGKKKSALLGLQQQYYLVSSPREPRFVLMSIGFASEAWPRPSLACYFLVNQFLNNLRGFLSGHIIGVVIGVVNCL